MSYVFSERWALFICYSFFFLVLSFSKSTCVRKGRVILLILVISLLLSRGRLGLMKGTKQVMKKTKLYSLDPTILLPFLMLYNN